MARERRSRSWWRQTVARWKRGDLSAEQFAASERISPRTLLWWSSALRRDTRAERGSDEAAIAPIEIEVPATAALGAGRIEIDVDGARMRVDVGTDIEYVAALVRRLGSERGC